MAAPIDVKTKLEINGSEQWVYFRGNSEKPVLLFVHGGPGFPFSAIARSFEQPFLDDFLVVHWDQRGAGKSFANTDFSIGFTIDQFVKDGIAVALEIQTRYPQAPIVLVGHSWGTIIGAEMAAKEPSLFHSCISVGTNSSSMESEVYRYNFLVNKLEEEQNFEGLKTLKEIGAPPWASTEFEFWSGLLLKHIPFEWTWGNIPRSKVEEAPGLALQSGDYTQQELEKALTEGMPKSNEALSKDYYDFDAIRDVPKIDIPVYFLQGSIDFNTPSQVARKYYDALVAPRGKHWRELENHGHMVFYENPKYFLSLVYDSLK